MSPVNINFPVGESYDDPTISIHAENVDERDNTFISDQFLTRHHSIVHVDSIDSAKNIPRLDTVIDKSDLGLTREISSPSFQHMRNVYLTQDNTEDSDYL